MWIAALLAAALQCCGRPARAQLLQQAGPPRTAEPLLRSRPQLSLHTKRVSQLFLQARAKRFLGCDTPGVTGCGTDCAGCDQVAKLQGTTPLPFGPPLPIPPAPLPLKPLSRLPPMEPKLLPDLGLLPTEMPLPPQRQPPSPQAIRMPGDQFQVGTIYQGKDVQGTWRLVNLTKSVGGGKFEADVLSKETFSVLRHWPTVYGHPEVLKPTISPEAVKHVPGSQPGEWLRAGPAPAPEAAYEALLRASR
mmetsp:Transcript_60061/g.113323  ORF Transcript_60061/g.113323 Transcript_60061/m.113323 type:complete len:248 (-) Transcript_60061:126-869(-)